MVQVNKTKTKILEGQVVIGAGVAFYAPILVELYGAMGFDWVWIDCEHGSSNDSETENMVRAAELYDITPVVRIPNAEPSTILRFLDRGAQGLIVPHISNRAQAEAVVHAAKYSPMGSAAAPPAGAPTGWAAGCPPRNTTRRPTGRL